MHPALGGGTMHPALGALSVAVSALSADQIHGVSIDSDAAAAAARHHWFGVFAPSRWCVWIGRKLDRGPEAHMHSDVLADTTSANPNPNAPSTWGKNMKPTTSHGRRRGNIMQLVAGQGQYCCGEPTKCTTDGSPVVDGNHCRKCEDHAGLTSLISPSILDSAPESLAFCDSCCCERRGVFLQEGRKFF